MNVVNSPDGVHWVGVKDGNRRLFDALIPLPQGTTHNIYLVKGGRGLVSEGDRRGAARSKRSFGGKETITDFPLIDTRKRQIGSRAQLLHGGIKTQKQYKSEQTERKGAAIDVYSIFSMQCINVE